MVYDYRTDMEESTILQTIKNSHDENTCTWMRICGFGEACQRTIRCCVCRYLLNVEVKSTM